MGTAAGAASLSGDAAKKLADAKRAKFPANPHNIVVVNTNYNEIRWGVYKENCEPVSNVVYYCRETNPIPPLTL